MTVIEDVHLVFQAAVLGDTGSTLVLDMGTPVRITDLAQHIIVRSGRGLQIQFTRLREGEKLEEKLQGLNEKIKPTTDKLISSTRVIPQSQLPINL